MQSVRNSQTKNDLLNLLSGATGSIIHDSIMTPADMLKQRKQICSKNLPIWTMVKDIYKTEGIKAF